MPSCLEESHWENDQSEGNMSSLFLKFGHSATWLALKFFHLSCLWALSTFQQQKAFVTT